MNRKQGNRTSSTLGISRTAGRVAAPALLGALVVALLAVVSTGCAGSGDQSLVSSKPIPASPEELLTQLKEDKTRIDQATDQMMSRIDTFNASRQPGERTLQFSEIFSEDLTADQRDILNTLVQQEKDVSYKALLGKIIADRDSIRSLQEKVMRLEQTLPDKFVVARKGDSHHALALAYLTGEAQVAPEKAKTLLAQADQTDVLLPGNKVWFFYDPQSDGFRTYVTQGEAGQSPLAVRRALQRRLITERDAAQAQVGVLERTKTELEANVSGLEATRRDLQGDVATLRQNKADLESNVDRLSRDIAFRQNSLFYHAATTRDLREKGVLSPALKRLVDVKGIHFDDALDLRQGSTITLTPGALGLERIKGVRLLPGIFQEGRDFTIETAEDQRSAKVTILDPDVFRGKEVLLAVGG